MQCIDKFIKNWPEKNTLQPIKIHDLIEIEDKLKISFPESYKYLVVTCGLLHSPNVMTRACDLSVDVSQVQDFLSLADIHSLSELYEMSGMLTGYVLFASDSDGNMYCFKKTECKSKREDAAVYLFNNSLNNVSKITESFITWLLQFNAK